jgi:hypothetical protein
MLGPLQLIYPEFGGLILKFIPTDTLFVFPSMTETVSLSGLVT